MSVSQLAYGLQIEVNVPLPGLKTESKRQVADVSIILNDTPAFILALLDSPANFYCSGANSNEHGEPNLRVAVLSGGQHYGFFYNDGARFAVAREGHKIWGDWPHGYTLEDACTYLIGPVIAFALRLRGATCLHASAVAVDRRAIVLMGLSGAGKSTTAAAFARLGFPVLSDDVVALAEGGDGFLVQPGYPRLNLWPDSVRALFGSEDALPCITPTWGKRYMRLDADGFASLPLPLGAVYILEDRDETLTVPLIEETAGREALMTLVSNTYGHYFLNTDMQKDDFDVLSRVVAQVPVRRVRPPADPARIYALCNSIEADARKVSDDRRALEANS